ncbi:MAG: hypothetical protein SO010_04915 [Candidatus Limiplasma sp.]|nr:hypothetical protein [Candidatus Limiplasma sp.]MDY4062233.1 hypothetical protein [Candidatus Limiplasma sp.]
MKPFVTPFENRLFFRCTLLAKRRKSFYNTEGRKSPIWALAGKRFGRKDIFNGENCDENAAGGDGRR